jgi:methionyl-tRNA formyltransferase
VSGPPSRSAGSQPPARVVFFGSGTFALPILEALRGTDVVELVGVITPPDRAVGRRGRLTPVPVAAEARRLGLPVLQPERVRSAETAAAIAGLTPDLAVLADFGRIVPPPILDLPPFGFLNVHPSLLPRHRGATPVPATIVAGDPEAGVSIMRMDAGLDTGPLLGARSWPLHGTETAPELEARASREGAELLVELLGPYLHGELAARPQDETQATLTRPLRREDGRLDPGLPAVRLERGVRAYQPWPGSFVESPAGRLAVLAAEPAPSEPGDRPGELVADADGLALVTSDGRLRLHEVQGAGGRPMSGAAFRRGHPAVLGRLVAAPV